MAPLSRSFEPHPRPSTTATDEDTTPQPVALAARMLLIALSEHEPVIINS